MRMLLKRLWVLQEVSNRNRHPKLGKGYFNAYRLNPLNPLSYIVILITFVVGVLMFGFVGVWKETDLRNPFKWN